MYPTGRNMYGRMYPPIFRKDKIIGFCALVIGGFILAKLFGLLDASFLIPNEILGTIAAIILTLFGLVLVFNNEHHGYY